MLGQPTKVHGARCAQLLVALLGCAGCGDAPTSSVVPAGVPRLGGELRLVQEAPISLDPVVGDSVYESLPVNQIFDGLVRLEPAMTVAPALAESWTVCRKGLVYEFRLRPGVRFHDGSPLTAEDVVHSLSRVLEPGRERRNLAYAYLLRIEGAQAFAAGTAAAVSGLEAPDDTTVRVRLARPYASFLEVLAMEGASIVPRATLLRMGEEQFGRAPVGTGPFRFATWDGDALRLAANPDYFGAAPLLDAVAIHFWNDDEVDEGARRFLDGEIDVLEPSSATLEQVGTRPGVEVFRYQELSLSFLGLNLGRPPLDNVLVRRAVAHAVNREALIAAAPDMRRVAAGIVPPGMAGYSPVDKALAYDPDRSRELLAEAGHPGGVGLVPLVLFQPSQSSAAEHVLRGVERDLRAVGIPVETRRVSWPEMNAALEEGTAPAFLLGWVADLTDPDAFLSALFESSGSGNYFAYADEETDRLLAAGAETMGPAALTDLYRRIERHVLEQVPIVPLYHTRGVIAMRRQVRGLEPGPLGLAKMDLERVWLGVGRRRS